MSLGASADVGTTETYVRANYALVMAGRAKLASSEAALQGLLARVRRECPMVVAGSPQNEASEKLTWELAATMRLVAFHRVAGPIGAFARTALKLRWSSARLTSDVHEYAHRLSAEATGAPPNLCADLRTWKASGYTKLPADTLAFDNSYYPVQAIGMLPKHMLAPFLSSAENGVLQRTSQLEGQLSDFEANAVETWGSIMDAVALNP